MSERAPYSSECQRCGHERVQGALSSEELREMLDTGAASGGRRCGWNRYTSKCREHLVAIRITGRLQVQIGGPLVALFAAASAPQNPVAGACCITDRGPVGVSVG
jgi:hypothetical protein